MKITMIGAGNIGGSLARAWTAKGHSVTTRGRDNIAAACTEAEVVGLAVPFRALEQVLEASGDLSGKVVIDCTNPVGITLPVGFASGAEWIASKTRGRVVKSFNAQGAENIAQPGYGSEAASNFYCGDDAEAKRIVHTLVADIGFDPVDAGPLANAKLLESATLLWFAVSKTRGTRRLAFRLLREG